MKLGGKKKLKNPSYVTGLFDKTSDRTIAFLTGLE